MSFWALFIQYTNGLKIPQLCHPPKQELTKSLPLLCKLGAQSLPETCRKSINGSRQVVKVQYKNWEEVRTEAGGRYFDVILKSLDSIVQAGNSLYAVPPAWDY
jgi:hypothetical protein